MQSRVGYGMTTMNMIMTRWKRNDIIDYNTFKDRDFVNVVYSLRCRLVLRILSNQLETKNRLITHNSVRPKDVSNG